MADFVMAASPKDSWNLAEGAFGAPLWCTVMIGPLLYAFLLLNTASDRLVSPSTTSLVGSMQAGVPSLPIQTYGPQTNSRTKNKLSSLVPVLRRNNSQTPMMSERLDRDEVAPREIRVTVQVRTDEYEEDKD